MDRETIITQTTSYIEQSRNNLEVENAKIDFKAQWYDLSDMTGINEFLKDSSAIANTFGPDGLIIIGYDDKTKVLTKVSFKDSKLRDTAAIIDLINKKVDRLFSIDIIETQIDGKTISIIHIPPSFDKPHIIRNYQNTDKKGNIKEEQQKIFVRNGSRTNPAGKHDIDLMYYDRKNILPEYRLLASFHHKNIRLAVARHPSDEQADKETSMLVEAKISTTLENMGQRPVSIIGFSMKLSPRDPPDDYETIPLESTFDYRYSPLILQPGQILTFNLSYKCEKFVWQPFLKVSDFLRNFMRHSAYIKSTPMTLKHSSGRETYCNVIISK